MKEVEIPSRPSHKAWTWERGRLENLASLVRFLSYFVVQLLLDLELYIS